MPKEFKGCPTDRSGVGIFMALEAAILMGVSANGPLRNNPSCPLSSE
jgi:hypothetical protein